MRSVCKNCGHLIQTVDPSRGWMHIRSHSLKCLYLAGEEGVYNGEKHQVREDARGWIWWGQYGEPSEEILPA